MGKRITFAALLCLCAALLLLPAAALAETAASVIVGGKTLDGTTNVYATTDSNGAVTLGGDESTYNIKFQNGVLTLKNAKIAGVTRDYRGFSSENYAIFAAGDLRLVLEGVNTVYSADNAVTSAGVEIWYATPASVGGSDGNLTIEGEGSLHAYNPEGGTKDQVGISVYGVLTVNSGTITAEGKRTANGRSFGVVATNGFAMTGGTLTAVGGDVGGSNNASAGLASSGSIAISGGAVTATSGAATFNSFGLSAGSVITISASVGGAVKVTAKTTDTTLQYRGAFNKQPTFSDGAVYTWRKDESSTPTSSTVTPYTRGTRENFTELTLAQACATPVITPAAGSYLLPQSVTLACDTPGAVLRYTTDGTEPTETSAAYTAGTPIVIAATATVKAKAFHASGSPSGTATAAYTITGSAPVIGAQPGNQTVTVGSSATFTVAATGNPTPGYQWQLSTDGGANWSDLTDSTSASYTIAATTITMSGYQYRCAVSNGFLPVLNSDAAILTVNPLHTLTVINGTGSGDYTAGARVSIAANAPPAGRQFKAWVVTSGGGSIAASGYQYRCAVSNGFLSAVTSNAATLTVNPLHTLTVLYGTGSGDYTAGARVSIAANAPPAGQQFKAWVVTSGGGSIVASANASTQYVMPNNAATITATYEAVVVPPTTGDNSRPLLWLGMCLLCGLGLALTLRKKRGA